MTIFNVKFNVENRIFSYLIKKDWCLKFYRFNFYRLKNMSRSLHPPATGNLMYPGSNYYAPGMNVNPK